MADPGFQRFLIKTLLALPRPVLRGLSGGGVVYVGGRTLDPRLQFLASQGRRAPPMSSATPEEARAASAAGLAPLAGPLEPGTRIEHRSIESEGGPIPVRVYRPGDQDPDAPLMIYAHFGGGVIGDLDTCETFCSILARVTRGPVMSVQYRLAPEHRFPAGLEDVLSVWRWARDNTAAFGAPAGRLAVGGDSMGGNFAAVLCQEMKRAGEPQPVAQLLIYPAVDVASDLPSMTTYGEAYPLSRATMEWFMGHYMNADDSPDDPRLSPIKAEDLTGLAPAVIATAGFDPLLDQGEAYARRLKEAGVPVTYRCYDHLSHAFTAFTGVAPAADAACRQIAGLVRQTYEGK